MSYRKLYEKHIDKIPKGYEVHHIDFNHKNNNIDNLIAIPKKVHTVIHQCGFMNRNEIQNLLQIYKINEVQ